MWVTMPHVCTHLTPVEVTLTIHHHKHVIGAELVAKDEAATRRDALLCGVECEDMLWIPCGPNTVVVQFGPVRKPRIAVCFQALLIHISTLQHTIDIF